MNYRVLIVEDDPMVSMINEQYVLKNENFQVAGTCRNGQEAIQFLEQEGNAVDLILLDVYMPVMDGIETLKKIRQMKIDCEVIMVTAANDTSTIENTMHLGVLDYLIKPFACDRFNVSLEKMISKKQLLSKNTVLDQKSLDTLISNVIDETKSDSSLGKGKSLSVLSEKKFPKGIQKKTLDIIAAFFQKNTSWHTVDLVSEELGISVVTVRNYLNYLVKENFIEEDINYSTGGRPSMLYKLL